jgi:hypothetical protein
MQPVLTFGCSPNALSGAKRLPARPPCAYPTPVGGTISLHSHAPGSTGVGCNGSGYNSSLGYPTGGPDPRYGEAPYWYFSAQYVLGWGAGMARGSAQMIRTQPGRRLYSEISCVQRNST